MKHVVGIDVETTSLDPKAGEIIEVAAIRYDWKTGEEIDRLETLAGASRPLEQITTEITGITQEMIDSMPLFKEIAGDVATFVGDDLIFAHNASFDVGWLQQHGVKLKNNLIWDTFPLSGIAWPEAESYNLGSLAAMLGIEGDVEHRAGADVEVNMRLLGKIRDACSVDEETYADIKKVLKRDNLSHYIDIFSLYKGTNRQPQREAVPTSSTDPIAYEDVFSTGGALDSHFETYTYRQQQQDMADVVMNQQVNGGFSLIEAATGTGKTFAYLTPLLLTSDKSKRSLISTHTKHLQDQLVQTDIPALQQALGTSRTVATLKGRNNYVCSRRLKALLQPTMTLS